VTGLVRGVRCERARAFGLSMRAPLLDPKGSFVPAYRFEHVFLPSGSFRYDANIFKLGFRYSM
jgi:hypothetical protein